MWAHILVDDFPVTLDVLIDHGSSAVLISNEYVTKLRLQHKCLQIPYSAKLSMDHDSQKTDIHF